MTKQTFAPADPGNPGNPPADPTNPPGVQNPPADQPFLRVGERTFNSQEDVVTKITAADDHIAKLEEEKRQTEAQLAEALEVAATFKEQADKSKSVTEMIEGLTATQQQQQQQPEQDQPALSTEEIAAKVLESLDARTQQQKEVDNFEASMSAAQQALGDNFKETVAKRATELGMSITAVDALAKRSPKAFSELMLPKQAPNGGPTSTVFSPEPTQPVERKNFTKLSFKERKAYIKALAERLKS